MTEANNSDNYIEIAGAKIHMLKAGSGDAVLSLHSIEGNLGWLPYLEALSRSACVYAPTHPGFGTSERPDWLETIDDLARFYLWTLDELGLGKVHLIGVFMGGWIAAEMAVMCPQVLQSLTLIGAAGVRPTDGEIADIFLLGEEETINLAIGNSDVLAAAIDAEEPNLRIRGREMTTRLCWKPYMHDPSLIHLLPRVQVPTLVVWGENDCIVPVSAGERIADTMPNARLEVVEGAGHLPHIEKPEQVTPLLLEHMGLSG
ncbi:MAG: alpha/beta fold hydrolase [Chloroflexota bacterium]|nr:alpha/beta fold hydrolase [Chloroflexota bacterium]